MATVAAPQQEGLVALLQESIVHVERNEFHPVLYQALGALHGYVGTFSGASFTQPSSATVARPAFSKFGTKERSGTIVSGWLEMLSPSTGSAATSNWESVLLILESAGNKDQNHTEYTLRVTREQGSMDGTPPELETLYQCSLPGELSSCNFVNFYGDPRLNITLQSKRNFHFRSQTKSAALNWCSELDNLLRRKDSYGYKEREEEEEEEEEEEIPVVKEMQEEEEVSLQEENSPDVNNLDGHSVEVELNGSKNDIVRLDDDNYRIQHCNSSSSSIPNEIEKQISLEEGQLENQTPPQRQRETEERVAQEQKESPKLAEEISEVTEKTVVEEKKLDAEKLPSQTTATSIAPQPKSANNTGKPSKSPAAVPSPKQATTTTPRRPATQAEREWNMEQRKKATAEKRRQEVELQRKLARTDQKRKDLEQRRRFLETEQRKEGLKQKAGNADAASHLKRIAQQIKSTDSELKEQQLEVAKIRAEIQEHKKKPLEAFFVSNVENPETIQKKLAAEQAKREQELERQKKEAFEKHRQELERQRKIAWEEQKKKEQEKKRRFLDEEQRKHNLVATAAAKAEKQNTDDPGLLKKLSTQMSALDEEVERHRAQKAKEEGEVDRDEDSGFIHKKLSEQLRQSDMQADVSSSRRQRLPSDVDPFAHLSNSGSMEEEEKAAPRLRTQHWYQQTTPTSPVGSSVFTNQQSTPQESPNPSYQYQRAEYQRPHRHHNGEGVVRRSQPNPNDQAFGGNDHSHFNMHHGHQHHQPNHKHRSGDPSTSGAPSQQPSVAERTHSNKQDTQHNNSEEEGTTDMSELKRQILVGWALQPPMLQTLRPIDQLICDIKKAFPSSEQSLVKISRHSYFEDWKGIARSDLGSGAVVEEKKLNKAVRKVKTFLHPDKLPKDLSEEHQFMCKLLWDVIQDAWEDHKKAKEELDWMSN